MISLAPIPLILISYLALVASQSCRDSHGNCQFWASIGECESNEDWMNRNCPLSCKECRVATSTCLDFNAQCPRWARTAECRNNPTWMRRNCRKSCKVCATEPVQNNRVQQEVREQTRRTTRAPPATAPPVRAPPATAPPTRATRATTTLPEIESQLPPGCNFVAVREDFNRRIMSANDVLISNNNQGCVFPTGGALCANNACYNRKFRTLDGTCNNMGNPTMGAAFSPYIRLMSPQYDNGGGAPAGGSRPSAREVSRILLRDGREFSFPGLNALLVPWGQFVTHDIAKTTQGPNTCNNCFSNARCFPIRTFRQDFRFGNQGCLTVARSSPVCRSFPREQFNENTAFLDASQVYSSSARDVFTFRNGGSGFMRTRIVGGRVMTPVDEDDGVHAGDSRANVFIGLAALHVLFVREHNRIVAGLSNINRHWNGDRLFQEARKIMGAQMQVITYQEYLPKILGGFFNQRIGGYGGYKANVNPGICQTFTAAAFRFGHGMIQNSFSLANSNFQRVGGIGLGQSTFNSGFLFGRGIDQILLGLMTQPAKMPQRMASGVTENLFGNTDLGAMNIQRGRDHGVPSYNTVRRFCGLPRVTDFSQYGSAAGSLAQMYRHPDNMDFYIGGALEDPEANAAFGPTFACIIGDQFRRLRDGDRFWFENPGIFTRRQLAELRKSSLARILCNSGDFVRRMPRDAFRLTNGANAGGCGGVPFVDLTAWREFQ